MQSASISNSSGTVLSFNYEITWKVNIIQFENTILRLLFAHSSTILTFILVLNGFLRFNNFVHLDLTLIRPKSITCEEDKKYLDLWQSSKLSLMR